jgi:hypothetical protein
MSGDTVTARFNYTARKRIDQEDVTVSFESRDGKSFVTASIAHEALLDLPLEATVTLEVYRRTTTEEFSMGTVASLQSISEAETREFPDLQGALARVKVVAVESQRRGQILAAAEQLRPAGVGNEPGKPPPLLLFKPSSSLDQEVWALDLEEEVPTVLLNERLEDWYGLAKSQPFASLVYPEVVRRIARWIADELVGEDEPTAIQAAWLKFFRNHGAPHTGRELEEPEDKERWSDECAKKFAIRNQFVDKYITEKED